MNLKIKNNRQLLTIILVASSLLINSITCQNRCTNGQMTCVFPGNEPIVLDADIIENNSGNRWKRGDQAILLDGTEYSNSDRATDDGKIINSITINNVGAKDVGLELFTFSKTVDPNNSTLNKFTVFPYDSTKMNPQFTLTDVNETVYFQTKYPEEEEAAAAASKISEFTLQSFKPTYHLKYRLEALPFDKLWVNGKEVEAKKCETLDEDDSYLNCLEYVEERKFRIDDYEIKTDITYSYENKNYYDDVLKENSIEPKTYSEKVDFKFPAKVDKPTLNLYFSEIEEQKIELVCKAGGNPSVTNYKWKDATKTELESSTDNIYVATIAPKNQEDKISFYCEVSNGLDSGEFADEAEMEFYISYREATTTMEPTTAADDATQTPTSRLNTGVIVAIVIGSLAGIGLIIGLIITMFHFKNKGKKTQQANQTNGRQIEMNANLSSNPVYGQATKPTVTYQKETKK